MAEAADNPTITHPMYDAMLASWRRCRDFVAGSDAVKAGGALYLPPLSWRSNASQKYAAYKDRAFVEPATGRAVEACLGTLFRKVPTIVGPDPLLADLQDVTLQGESVLAFSVRAALEVLTVGGFLTLLDFGAARPYWIGYRREQVINWDTAVQHGDTMLKLLVLEEYDSVPDPANRFKMKTITRYRVLELVDGQYTVTVWTKAETQGYGGAQWVPSEPIVPTRRAQPLDFIPCVFLNPMGAVNDPAPAKPPLLDLVNVNLSHYRVSADYRQALHFCGLPQPYITGASTADALEIGGSSAWQLDSPDAKVGMLECKADSVGALRQALMDLHELMLSLGARLASGAGPETATAARIRHSAETATLRNIAAGCTEALSTLARWHDWWSGRETPDNAIAITLSLVADTRLSSDDVRALLEAFDEGAVSWSTVYEALQRGEWTTPGVTADAERARIAAHPR